MFAHSAQAAPVGPYEVQQFTHGAKYIAHHIHNLYYD